MTEAEKWDALYAAVTREGASVQGPMLKNGRSKPAGMHDGCSCCNSKQVRRAAKKAAKQRERRGWQQEAS